MTLLKIADVETRTGIDRVTIWRLERSGSFPRRRLISGRSVRWIDSEIDAWIQALPTAKLLEVAV
jgi:predicted DNA-binding transcriptional regulator AlpA